MTALSAMLAWVLLATWAVPGAAAGVAQVCGGHAPRSGEELGESVDAQSFLDTRVPEFLEEYGVPGAVATIVSSGERTGYGGYGHADAEHGSEVDPDRHVFPVGSIAKVFTAVAVLQLAEEGRIDLHEDVNAYLPENARVPATPSGRPVTTHHLLTHTAGFEEAIAGQGAFDSSELASLPDHVAAAEPRRIFEPGEFVAYSNHSLNLAGLIVEEVSGTPFGEYVRTHVFEPLGMADSAFGPLHELARAHDLPVAHRSDGTPVTGYHLGGEPSGLAIASASDMARFLQAVLNGGELDGERVLSEESVTAMLDRQAGGHPEVTGVGYGTWEWRLDRPRVVGHAGDLFGFHSMFVVVPEAEVGFHVAINGDGTTDADGRDMRMALSEAFIEEFAPVAEGSGTDSSEPLGTGPSAGPGPAEEEAAVPPGGYAGTYVATRRTTSGPASVYSLLSWVRVRQGEDGAVVVDSVGLPEQRFLPLGGGLFEERERRDRIGFITADDQVTGLSFDTNPTTAYQRVAWPDSPRVHAIAVGAALLVLATVLVWPALALVRLLRRRPSPPRGAAAARWCAALAALGAFATVGMFAYLFTDPNLLLALFFADSPVLLVPLTLGAAATLAALVLTALAWRRGWWSAAWRVHHTLVTVAALFVVLIGVRYHLVWPLG
ncbi:serine hydrolase domain-containing protein [Nocardiopsis lucentensis]|uniref:serine hydrolase domain-containing protein n=1 Tax=Nocardiopsis lucentensis TaxID=53441 RepID=UPI00035E92FC|nr:serine hydrolase domain-containing protein [Nocardiopsis lucentensis]